MGATRPLRMPREGFEQLELPLREEADLVLFRVHARRFGAVFFSRNQTHRFSHSESSAAFMYAGEDPESCLWECFGDQVLEPGARISRSIWEQRSLSRITCPELLRICDLTELRTRRALGVDLSALKHVDLAAPQAWGRAIAGHPAQVDAIRFPSRFTGQACVVAVRREEGAMPWAAMDSQALTESAEAEEFLESNGIALV